METTSPFASKLGTNYAATNEEAAELTTFLAGPISKLADLQDEINRTKAHYDKLVERHAELANEISRHQAFMAPHPPPSRRCYSGNIHKMPPDDT